MAETTVRQTYRALKESEERFRLIAETITEVFWMADVEISRIFYVSPAYEKIWGRRQQELYENPRSFIDAIHPDDRARALKVLEGQKEGKPFDGEYRILRPDQSVRWIWDRGFPVPDADGKIRRYVGVAQDITDRKSMEEERVKAQKLESVGLLAGGIAHDFNNLLTVITGGASLLRELRAGDIDATDVIAQVEQAARHAKELTDQLLAFAKGGLPQRIPASLGDVLRESVTFSLRGSGVRCEFAIPANLPLVELDRGQVGQVFRNLTLNAVQAMRGTGLLEVSARAVPGESAVEARFRDHGTGIDKAHLDKIFDPYFTTKEKGHGLGLATSFLIIKRHGGTIQVASEVGVGSTFTVRLPVGAAKIAAAAPKATAPVPASYRILVMEDDALIRKLIGRLLEARGHRTAFAVDGDEAIARYREGMASREPFDLVIMDLTIPGGMGGKEAIGHLRTLDPNVRAIVSSGYCDDPILSDYRRYGFQAVLGKPYSLEEMVSTLNKVMAGRAAEVGNAS